MLMSHPLIEFNVGQRVLAIPNLQVREGAAAFDLAARGGLEGVEGKCP